VTNSTNAQEALIEKMKIKSIVIPNTVDVDHLQRIDDYNRDFREAFGIKDDQFLFLQPTRINRKKCVERSIKLVKEINEATKKDHVLMITGSPVYFRGDYFEEVIRKINKAKINAILAHDRIFISRHQNKDQKFYSIDDAYLNADMVLFPSQSEDFGLPVLYAMAYKKPLFVNKYPNLKDILEKEPRFILMDGKMTNETVSDVFEVLHNKQKREEMIAHNFEMINKHYNSDLLDDKIVPLLNKFEKKSFIKRLKTRFFTRRPVHEKAPHKNEANNAAKTAENKEVKNENLKNRKGGYKEPVKS
ncbi:MAG: glycosyltransferase family 4 protein, partial [Nanoarchaeota archaeon]|nr:glycosyltransferase family 4 protein [Nanoarchaeota archaeon]